MPTSGWLGAPSRPGPGPVLDPHLPAGETGQLLCDSDSGSPGGNVDIKPGSRDPKVPHARSADHSNPTLQPLESYALRRMRWISFCLTHRRGTFCAPKLPCTRTDRIYPTTGARLQTMIIAEFTLPPLEQQLADISALVITTLFIHSRPYCNNNIGQFTIFNTFTRRHRATSIHYRAIIAPRT